MSLCVSVRACAFVLFLSFCLERRHEILAKVNTFTINRLNVIYEDVVGLAAAAAALFFLDLI